MITIKKEDRPKKPNIMSLSELLKSGNTCFIGSSYRSSKNSEPLGVYLISICGIISLEDPKVAWVKDSAEFVIDRFVDIEITIKE